MKFSELIQVLESEQTAGDKDPQVLDIAYDSRLVRPGSLFVAVPGFHTDGHDFIENAVKSGAVGVVSQEDHGDYLVHVPLLKVKDSRRALADIVNKFYDYPSKKLGVIGVTGTDGKTTTSYLTIQLLERAGHLAGLISTVFFQTKDGLVANDLRQTTPESLEIQSMLAEMVAADRHYAVVESTSHALALDRLAGCEYDVAVMTNITHEHLDYHGTFEGYRGAKSRLFEMMDSSMEKSFPKAAVINADDPSADFFRSKTSKRVFDYGIKNPASISADEIVSDPTGSDFTLTTPVGSARIRLPLPAEFNIYNAMAAAGAVLSQGVDFATICAGLEAAKPVPGRMQTVDAGQPFTVIVDYAHTPGAIEKVLSILRPLTTGRLISVFGSAGERDVAKRSMQGRIAAKLCDFCVFANEDPRFEDEWKILRDIAEGAAQAGKTEGRDFVLIPDRREAIAAAVDYAREGDTILLAGKGHESCIIYGDEKRPWDEARVAFEVLHAKYAGCLQRRTDETLE